jgi:anthranilate/para-aminobenzoate synthase component II
MDIARTDRVVMAVAHRSAPQFGVQFHPESILTPDGGRIIDNVIRWAGHARQ